MIIYKVTNKLNQKIYIGKTVQSLSKRRSKHYGDAFKRNSKTNFHRALRKYEKDSFDWVVIDTTEDEETLNRLEVKYISEYNSYKEGYNQTKGANGGLTYEKGSELYQRIKHKLGNWENGNPGATPEAIQKRIKTFMDVKWPSGPKHGNIGHKRNVGKLTGKDNPMYGKYPTCQLVEIDGIEYNSLGEAARAHDVTRATIKNRCKSELYPTWRLLGVKQQTEF